MDWIERQQIEEILQNNMDLTKEQYYETVELLEELDAEFINGQIME